MGGTEAMRKTTCEPWSASPVGTHASSLPPSRLQGVFAMRRVDTLAFIGLFLLFVGAGTFLGKYSALPLWVVWLVGPLLWYLGFAVLISWMLWRLFVPVPHTAAQEEHDPAPVRESNFLEHDSEIPLEPRMRKVPVYSTIVLLILLSFVFIAHSYAADNAAETFKGKCVMCHGADGQGKTPMGAKLNIQDLASPEVQKQSTADLSQTIAKGKNKMPAYDGKLSNDEIAQLAAYVKALGKK
jgi:cytochrome c6